MASSGSLLAFIQLVFADQSGIFIGSSLFPVAMHTPDITTFFSTPFSADSKPFYTAFTLTAFYALIASVILETEEYDCVPSFDISGIDRFHDEKRPCRNSS